MASARPRDRMGKRAARFRMIARAAVCRSRQGRGSRWGRCSREATSPAGDRRIAGYLVGARPGAIHRLVADARADISSDFHWRAASSWSEAGLSIRHGVVPDVARGAPRGCRYGSLCQRRHPAALRPTAAPRLTVRYVGDQPPLDRHNTESLGTVVLRVCAKSRRAAHFPARVRFVHARGGLSWRARDFFAARSNSARCGTTAFRRSVGDNAHDRGRFHIPQQGLVRHCEAAIAS
jgi:hypothetical protein